MTIHSLLFSIIFFVSLPFVIMSVLIFIPRLIGRYLTPSFSFENNVVLDRSIEEVYKTITDYENYPNIFKNIKKVEVEILPSGKKSIYEYYRFKKLIDLMSVREEENKICSLVRRTYEYTSLWTFNLIKKNENTTLLHLKETVYVYDNYLRFMLRFVLRGNIQRVSTLHSIKKYLKKIN